MVLKFFGLFEIIGVSLEIFVVVDIEDVVVNRIEVVILLN